MNKKKWKQKKREKYDKITLGFMNNKISVETRDAELNVLEDIDKILTSLILKVPKCKVYFDSHYLGKHNEYTIRNIQLAVKDGKVENKWEFVYKGVISRIDSDTSKINPVFKKGFYDLSYNLAFQLMD